MTDAPSKTQILQAQIAILLVVCLFVLGVAWYGITEESLGRLWSDILDRPGGPMTFRFILQPAMAIIAACETAFMTRGSDADPIFGP